MSFTLQDAQNPVILNPQTHYQVIHNETLLDEFLTTLPELQEDEVWYFALFGRHKYDPAFPNTKDSGQLARQTARDVKELKQKIRRLEAPIGSYFRDNDRAVASQQCMALYLSLNPKSLPRANKELAVQLVRRLVDGDTIFNPLSAATTELHKAQSERKFYVDFDFDLTEISPPYTKFFTQIQKILPHPEFFRALRTKGGLHLIVNLEAVRKYELKSKWHQTLTALPFCDVRGSNVLTPVPGCCQGGFIPHFVEPPPGIFPEQNPSSQEPHHA